MAEPCLICTPVEALPAELRELKKRWNCEGRDSTEESPEASQAEKEEVNDPGLKAEAFRLRCEARQFWGGLTSDPSPDVPGSVDISV